MGCRLTLGTEGAGQATSSRVQAKGVARAKILRPIGAWHSPGLEEEPITQSVGQELSRESRE